MKRSHFEKVLLLSFFVLPLLVASPSNGADHSGKRAAVQDGRPAKTDSQKPVNEEHGVLQSLENDNIKHRGMQVNVDVDGNLTFFYVVDPLLGETDLPKVQDPLYLESKYLKASMKAGATLRIRPQTDHKGWNDAWLEMEKLNQRVNVAHVKKDGRNYVVVIWRIQNYAPVRIGKRRILVEDQTKRLRKKEIGGEIIRSNYIGSIEFDKP